MRKKFISKLILRKQLSEIIQNVLFSKEGILCTLICTFYSIFFKKLKFCFIWNKNPKKQTMWLVCSYVCSFFFFYINTFLFFFLHECFFLFRMNQYKQDKKISKHNYNLLQKTANFEKCENTFSNLYVSHKAEQSIKKVLKKKWTLYPSSRETFLNKICQFILNIIYMY